MQVLPAGKIINFKGNAQKFDLDCSNHYRFTEVRPEHFTVPAEFEGNYFGVYGRNQNALEAIKKTMHPNCTVETVDTKFHPKSYNIVYYADPMEVVYDDIRKKCDFIVHDNEPKYPEPDTISDSYFGKSTKMYDEDFKTIRDYYYRLEMADRKTLAQYERSKNSNLNFYELCEKIDYYKNRISQSQYQQWQAEECRLKHLAAKDLITDKNITNSDIEAAKESLKEAPNSIKRIETQLEKLKAKKQVNDGIINDLRQKITGFYEVLRLNQHLKHTDGGKQPIHVLDINKETIDTYKLLNKTKIILNSYRRTGKTIKNEIETAYSYLEREKECLRDYPEKIKLLEQHLNEIKESLIPLFDKLKIFYAKQRIIK